MGGVRTLICGPAMLSDGTGESCAPARAASGIKPKSAPADVATPFPPLNFSQMGNECPITLATAPIIPNSSIGAELG